VPLAHGLALPDGPGPGLQASTNGQPLPAVPPPGRHQTLPEIILAAAGDPYPWPCPEMESLAAVARVFAGLEGLVFSPLHYFLMAMNGLANPSFNFWVFLPKPE
jgi:hypothetical protein